jgi:type II secretory pathway pseudopilin PulG
MARVRLRAHIRRASNNDESGMTLLELVVAFLIFGILMLGIAHTMGTGLALTRTNRHRSVAANLAAQEMDTVRSADFADIVVPATTTVDVDGIDYTVDRTVTWVTAGSTSSPCDSVTGTPEVLRVHVEVSWPDMNGIPPVESDTTITPPTGSYSPISGHFAVEVQGLGGRPMESVPVVLTGPQNQTLTTNEDGCAFFAFLPAGTYTVTLNGIGYVDDASNPHPFSTKPVTVGTTTTKSFFYEQLTHLLVSMQSPAASAIPNELPVTVWNANIFPSKQKTIAGSGATRTVDGLFPYEDGYYAWAGGCADADPEGLTEVGSPYWPGATRSELINVTPGGTSTTFIQMGDAQIVVSAAAGGPLADVEVVATHAADYLCPGETHVLGRTDAAGVLTTAIPYGLWELSVTGHTPAVAWPTVTIDPTVPAPVAAAVVTQ